MRRTKFRINMRSLDIPRSRLIAGVKFAAATALICAAAFSVHIARISAQDLPAIIGRIEGDDVQVVTKTAIGTETDAGSTIVASGSDVTLRSGHALLLLNTGGEISICGPAHFKLVKSAGALTLALDYGRVHPSLETSDAFTIYMPTVVATPIAIGGGARDMTVGLDPTGEMCVITARGAMRVEPQFSDQSMIIPQGGTANMAEGQIVSLHADASACSCEFPRARLQTPKPAPSSVPSGPSPDREVSTLARPPAPERKKPEDKPAAAPPSNEPVYTVLMPPLSFDAKSPEMPPDPAPETIVLVREVRMQSSVRFQGHVNPAPAKPAVPPVPPSAPVAPQPIRPAVKAEPGIFARIRAFFHRLIG
jgi:hypothetical protein